MPTAPAESTEILRQALRFLWHCGNDPRGRRETLKADGVRVISQYLFADDQRVREAAVCALNVVSLETKGKEDVLKHSQEGMARLLRNEEGETPYLFETCIQLARCASELPAFRFAFARLLVTDPLLLGKIYGTTALAAISPLLGPQEEAQVRIQATKVAAHFLHKPSAGDTIRVPPVCPLENIKVPQLFAFEECVDVLQNLVDLLSVARGPALECLQALVELERPRTELMELIDSGRVTVPEEFRFDISEMIAAQE